MIHSESTRQIRENDVAIDGDGSDESGWLFTVTSGLIYVKAVLEKLYR